MLAAVPEQEQQRDAALRRQRLLHAACSAPPPKFPLARAVAARHAARSSPMRTNRNYATVAVLGADRCQRAVPGRRGSARPVRAGQQPDLPGDRRDVAARRLAQRPGPGRRGAGALSHQPAAAVGPALPAQRDGGGRGCGAASTRRRRRWSRCSPSATARSTSRSATWLDHGDRHRDAEHDDDPARLDRGDLAAGGRHRRDEHHAGERHRTDARDRHPHGHRRAHAQHPCSSS